MRATSSPKSRLQEYARKRDFKASPEPPPDVPRRPVRKTRSKLRFCVQKHLASTLHYDLRLEHSGTLLSWAVPKGPSLNPADKRMAVRVEDHPLDYRTFEGVIPSGYGAGIVLLWDEGTWACEQDDIDAALKKGELKFTLHGVKLKGSWVLVRTRSRDARQEQWLLIKHRDHWSGDVDVATAAPDSVKSFGGFAEVLAASQDAHAFDKNAPVKGGTAGALFKQVIAEAAAGKTSKAADTRTSAKASNRRTRTAEAASRRKSSPARHRSRGGTAKPLPASAGVTGSHVPKLTNQAKVLYPETGFTKGQLVDYYQRAAPLILPHLRGRAVTLKRLPDGVDGKSFFEKRCASHRPDWVKTATVDSRHAGTIDYCLVEDVSTLMWTANLAAIELHVPLALADQPDTPTEMVFDLDPGPSAGLEDACRVALQLRDVLQALGLKSFAKTSGSKGIHLLVPLNTPGVTFDDTKAFAHAAAMMLQKQDPARVIASMSRSARTGKVFIDWSQNDRAKTTVCVYSARAKDRPTVSMPVRWKQVERGEVESPTADGKLPKSDAFEEVLTLKQKLPKVTS